MPKYQSLYILRHILVAKSNNYTKKSIRELKSNGNHDKKILVLDDDFDISLLIKQVLQKHRFRMSLHLQIHCWLWNISK
jgi:PleD family two-component response regulator